MLRRYVKLQLSCLSFGVVGPGFLIAYFAIGQPSDAKWMLYGGLVVTVVLFLIPPALMYAGAKSEAKARALEQSGVLALAQIVGISETGTTINDAPVVKIDLHIEGPGITPFDSQTKMRTSMTRQGNITARKLVVLVDPTTNEYQVDWQRSAWVNGLVPFKFTIREENRTYDLSGQAGPMMEILRILKSNKLTVDGKIDLRSNPAVAQQVKEVVRRAAVQPAQPQPAPAAQPLFTPPAPSSAQRLQELETLRATGAISDAEYTAKRQQIISQI